MWGMQTMDSVMEPPELQNRTSKLQSLIAKKEPVLSHLIVITCRRAPNMQGKMMPGECCRFRLDNSCYLPAPGAGRSGLPRCFECIIARAAVQSGRIELQWRAQCKICICKRQQ